MCRLMQATVQKYRLLNNLHIKSGSDKTRPEVFNMHWLSTKTERSCKTKYTTRLHYCSWVEVQPLHEVPKMVLGVRTTG